jgi:hypothetical protein
MHVHVYNPRFPPPGISGFRGECNARKHQAKEGNLHSWNHSEASVAGAIPFLQALHHAAIASLSGRRIVRFA